MRRRGYASPVRKIDFSAARISPDDARRLQPARNNVLPFTPDGSARAAQREPHQIPWRQRNEAISALLLALILHLAGFIVISDAPQDLAVMPPTPIQVSWIAAPRPAQEKTAAAPPKRQQTVQQPAPKTVKRNKPRHKSVLKTHAPATKMAAAPAESTANAPMPTAAKPAAAPHLRLNRHSRTPRLPCQASPL